MSDLFSDAARERASSVAPLALRLRPRTLDEFLGQEHILGEGSALRLAIAEDRMTSAILYGPPGSGKTTLARIVAGTTGAEFEELSAVSATVADVRGVLARARERLGANERRTILFLDEIHRFNKAQQDALLPAVEEGLVTLIGATTENPYFEVNSALLSRCQIYELEPLSPEDLEAVARRGLEALGASMPDDLVTQVSIRAGGDASRERTEVDRQLPRLRRCREGRPRARDPPAAARASRCELLRPQARPRQGLRLPPRGPSRLRHVLPARGAGGDALLRAE